MKTIQLTKGKFAIVDDDDYDWIMKWKWYVNSNGYAVRAIRNASTHKDIRMHREIANTPEGMDTDHINGNKLDNRKCNLRICTRSENHRNRCKLQGTASRYKGVTWNDRLKKWQTRIDIPGKQIYLGYYNNEISAALAYNEAAKRIFGEFAKLNII